MAHLWQPVPNSTESEPGWQPLPLSPDKANPFGTRAELRCVRSHSATAGGRDPWMLLPLRQRTSSLVTVNGEPLVLGMRVLADRDAFQVGDGVTRFFTSEKPAGIEPFPGLADGRPGTCARCRNPIAPGDPAVRCPACGAWTHQSDELPCWTYEGAETCPLCDQPNLLNVFRWTPESDGF